MEPQTVIQQIKADRAEHESLWDYLSMFSWFEFRICSINWKYFKECELWKPSADWTVDYEDGKTIYFINFLWFRLSVCWY